ncbi:MAG: hypothetical protein E7632_06735 [Ruminococcaceae bacterium]|nr:hypothetical protein [Oscillospiraceae bacterium]
MWGNHREFLRMLRREPGRPTLFEPHPTRAIATQLLWRGGDAMWDTVSHRVDTLIALYAYLRADTAVIPADAASIGEVLELSHKLPEEMRFTILTDDAAALTAADASNAVCAIASACALSGGDFAKPVIFMAEDDAGIESAIRRGASGVHIPDSIEARYDTYGRHIALLGGLGICQLNSDSPAAIHRRIRALHEQTGGVGYAIGTGSDGMTEANYLSFISMLGIFNNLVSEFRT